MLMITFLWFIFLKAVLCPSIFIWAKLENAHNSMRRGTELYSILIAEMNPRMRNTKRLTTKHVHITRHAQFSWVAMNSCFLWYWVSFVLLWLYHKNVRGRRTSRTSQNYYGWIDKKAKTVKQQRSNQYQQTNVKWSTFWNLFLLLLLQMFKRSDFLTWINMSSVTQSIYCRRTLFISKQLEITEKSNDGWTLVKICSKRISNAYKGDNWYWK